VDVVDDVGATGDEDDGGPANARDSSSEDVRALSDAPTPSDAPMMASNDAETGASITCTQVGNNAFNNGPNCSMSTVESCSNGVTYEASCSCQPGRCFCMTDQNFFSLPVPPGMCSSSCAITPVEALKACSYPL
jgi:hypothetical protein